MSLALREMSLSGDRSSFFSAALTTGVPSPYTKPFLQFPWTFGEVSFKCAYDDEDNNVALAYSLYIYPFTDLLMQQILLNTFNVLSSM